VAQATVDHLMEVVNELTVADTGLAHLAGAAEAAGDRGLGRRIRDHHAAQHRSVQRLQAAVTEVRLLPLSVAFAPLSRLVRDLGRRLGRGVDLVTSGGETTADKDVIEALGDPLIHLIRNAVDHGVEPVDRRRAAGKPDRGEVRLTAVNDGYAVIVEVTDDGRGIDPERLRRDVVAAGLLTPERAAGLDDGAVLDLVFQPAFSTAPEVSEVSGRGVGMDAVRAGIARLGGSVTLSSRPGRGTIVRLRLPVSMAVTPLMVVGVAGQRFGVPLDAVVETIRVAPPDVGRVLAQDVLVVRGKVVPVVDLSAALDLDWRPGPDDPVRALIVRCAGGDRVALRVQRFYREADLIVRPLDGVLAGHRTVSGAALLGDGLVLLVLNLPEILMGSAGAGS
jgi:two-component system chemotaxis sensor kinase CheA